MVKPSYDKLRKRKHIIVHHLNLGTLRGSFANTRPYKLDIMKEIIEQLKSISVEDIYNMPPEDRACIVRFDRTEKKDMAVITLRLEIPIKTK